MAVCYLLLQFIVAVSFFQAYHCLVCYDNVFNKELVLIDCSYRGAVCAVTNKTITTTTGSYPKRITSIESELLYHCAPKSCNKDIWKFCDGKAGLTVHCSAQCCNSDKCNMPTVNATAKKAVVAKDALRCYQLIGNREEKVKCLFEEAQCLSMEIKSVYGSIEKKGTQYCATKSRCSELKTCNTHYFFPKTCSMTCCKRDYCNPISGRYTDDDASNKGDGYYEDGISSGAIKWIGIGTILIVSLTVYTCRQMKKSSRERNATTMYRGPAPSTSNGSSKRNIEGELMQL